MASAIYPKFKEVILQGGVDMSSATIKAALVDTGIYTYSSAHDFYDDVSGVVGTPQTIGSKTFTSGLFDGADVTFTAVSGNTVEAIVIYEDTGNSATSHLIAYIDSASAGLPATPNGGDISITWNASGIFQL